MPPDWLQKLTVPFLSHPGTALAHQLDLEAHVLPRGRGVVLLARVHAALQALRRPAERRRVVQPQEQGLLEREGNGPGGHLITAADQDEQLVYDVTKMLWEQREQVVQKHPAGRAINPAAVVFAGLDYFLRMRS